MLVCWQGPMQMSGCRTPLLTSPSSVPPALARAVGSTRGKASRPHGPLEGLACRGAGLELRIVRFSLDVYPATSQIRNPVWPGEGTSASAGWSPPSVHYVASRYMKITLYYITCIYAHTYLYVKICVYT